MCGLSFFVFFFASREREKERGRDEFKGGCAGDDQVQSEWCITTTTVTHLSDDISEIVSEPHGSRLFGSHGTRVFTRSLPPHAINGARGAFLSVFVP